MKTSIYLPDDLGERVRELEISISEITQAALRAEINRIEARQHATTDIEKAAARLKATIDEDKVNQRKNGLEDGATWAKTEATAAELRVLARFFAEQGYEMAAINLPPQAHEWVQGFDFDYLASMDIDDDRAGTYWVAFVEGAVDIWKQVQPLL